MSIENIRTQLSNNIILFIGPPLSGKGTQGTLLAQVLGCHYVSSGDLFRTEASLGTELGMAMKSFMDAGQLIPNELTTDFLTKKLSEPMYHHGLILDGYPRSLSHQPIIENILNNLDRSIAVTIYLDVSKSILDERRLKRSRTDDSSDTFERRYAIFNEETVPLIEDYRISNKLITITSSHETVEEIHQRILSALTDFEQQRWNYLNSYQWLELKLTMGQDDKSSIYTEFCRRALEENEKQGRRTGIVRRIIYLRSANVNKLYEHIDIFEKLYGIEIVQVPSSLIQNDDCSDVITLLQLKLPGIVQLAVITERSNLYRPGTQILSSLSHGVRSVNQSKLTALWIDSETNELIRKVFEYSTTGRIDLRKRQLAISRGTIFGWDDIFVVDGNGMSYHELKELGIKHSSRDMVISAFLKERVHYKKLLNLKSEPQPNVKRTIDFSVDVADYVASHELYNNVKVIEYGFRNLITHVLNSGVFFRAARNRRQANYWSPGLNGGLPLTAKADAIHEATFMAHDFGHFAIPDLVFIGNDSILHRRAYIAWRMISEATTMALADMLFIDALYKSNVNYDFDKRRIYPLFRDLNIDFSKTETRLENLKQVIYANYRYCLLGDDSLYVAKLPQGKETPSLIEFKKKFGPFFVEDFRWTERNYENMVNRSEEMASWWKETESFRQLPHVEPIKSIDEFLDDIRRSRPDALNGDVTQLIDTIFDIVFESKVKPVLDLKIPKLIESSQRMFKGFNKWIMAQLAITLKFSFLPESEKVRKDILLLISSLSDGHITIEIVNQIRSIYEQYLDCLARKNLISHDDQQTYAELYPLFDPFYVNYDKDIEHYEDLSMISKRIFSIEDYRGKQIAHASRYLGRNLTSNELTYTKILLDLIEDGGGQIIEGIFVKKPGVMLLSPSPIKHRFGMVTFLLSGISIETAMEFVAHHEAKVARLTSSKTKAMNHPLFRVQDKHTVQQRQYLKLLIAHRAAFENNYEPRTSWGNNGNELFNMMQPGCKVTTLCYTMTLEDYHKLFIGRMNPSGNETEVLEVSLRMVKQLHELYPNFIREPSFYSNCENTAKYKQESEYTMNWMADDCSTLSAPINLLGKSMLTREAMQLMTKLNIAEGDDFERLAEFRSRITYLAFSKAPCTKETQKNYLNKIVEQHGHWSILDACQAVFRIPQHTFSTISDSQLNLFTFEKQENHACVFITWKRLRQCKETSALFGAMESMIVKS